MSHNISSSRGQFGYFCFYLTDSLSWQSCLLVAVLLPPWLCSGSALTISSPSVVTLAWHRFFKKKFALPLGRSIGVFTMFNKFKLFVKHHLFAFCDYAKANFVLGHGNNSTTAYRPINRNARHLG